MDIKALNKNSLLTALIEQSKTVFNIKDLDGKYIYANEQTRSYFSDPTADYIGKTDFDFFPAKIARRFRETDLQVIKTRQKTVLEENVNRASGVATHLSIKFPIFSDDEQLVATGMFTIDITRRKHQEEQQISALEKYQRLITALGEIAYEYHASSDRIFWSGEYEKKLGLTQEELGNTLADWLARIHPDDVNKVTQELQRAEREDQIFNAEYRFRCKNDEYLWFHDRNSITVDQRGKIIDIIGVMRNISTQRHNVEQKEQLQRQVLQIQKMDALGQLTGGIAHDFNNILSSIRGYTDLAQRLINTADSNKEKIQPHLEQVSIATNRAADLVQHLLSFSRGKTGSPELITPESGIQDAIRLLHSMIPSSVSIEVTLKTHHRYIRIDPTNLQQVLINLILNARDAIQDQTGKIEIILGERTSTNIHCASCHEKINSPMVSISIVDNGDGISSEEIFNRMFDPFFTTKEDRKGSGMGLSVVHGIMHSCQGHIVVNSTAAGTCFELLIPEVYEVPDAVAATESSTSIAHRNELRESDTSYIILIDDEVAIINYLAELLQREGLQVKTFSNPHHALEAFEAAPHECKLVITDQTMPELTGDKLAKIMLEIQPDLPIIMCSGYSDLIDRKKAQAMGIAEYFGKPINKAQLLESIYRLLRHTVTQ